MKTSVMHALDVLRSNTPIDTQFVVVAPMLQAMTPSDFMCVITSKDFTDWFRKNAVEINRLSRNSGGKS